MSRDEIPWNCHHCHKPIDEQAGVRIVQEGDEMVIYQRDHYEKGEEGFDVD